MPDNPHSSDLIRLHESCMNANQSSIANMVEQHSRDMTEVRKEFIEKVDDIKSSMHRMETDSLKLATNTMNTLVNGVVQDAAKGVQMADAAHTRIDSMDTRLNIILKVLLAGGGGGTVVYIAYQVIAGG